jgi:hypothetical protein
MFRSHITLILIVILTACSSEDTSKNLEGRWLAKWKTVPESFQGVKNIESYEMNGVFDFQGDSLTIQAYGFPGCIFGIDTISHTQGWIISNDSLHLINPDQVRGISYRITEMNTGELKLQLMEDIFISLQKE